MASQPQLSGRLRVDTSEILTLQPMIASTALFMRHREMPHDEPGKIADTNGVNVRVWPCFFQMKASDRHGILLHEYLHGAYAHPMRAVKLSRKLGEKYRHRVFNIAADAIINEGIKRNRDQQLTLPNGCVHLPSLVEQAEAVIRLTGVEIDIERMKNLAKLSVEWLYNVLVALEDSAQDHCKKPGPEGEESSEASKAGKDPSSGASSPGAPGQIPSGSKARAGDEEKLRDFLRNMQDPADLRIDEVENMSPGEIDDAIRNAAEKVRASISMGGKKHGNNRSSIFEVLEGDIPVVNTPWESSFRSITQRHLAKIRVRRPSLPGRHVLTQESMKLKNIVWSPGRARPSVPLAVVALDSSGSVGPEEYKRYLAEIQAMKRRTHAKVIVIVADTQIQSVCEINDVREIAHIEFKGRGGTNFCPALALAAEFNPDIFVYLTDLMGTFPEEKPSFPVLWTIPQEEVPANYEPPFGRVLTLG